MLTKKFGVLRMYKNKITRALFIGAGLSLALAGCGEKPAEKQAAEPAPAPAPEANLILKSQNLLLFKNWCVVTVQKLRQ
jgi:oligopeptide transport system substrate-binding protein